MSNFLDYIVTTLLNIFIWIGLYYYLSPYIQQKAKNLATKEDVKKITEKIEEVKNKYEKLHELSKTEMDFYNEMNTAIWNFLCMIKKRQFQNNEQITKEVILKDNEFRKKYFEFIDSANMILGKAFIFLPEESYILLKNAIGDKKWSLPELTKNLLYAMRHSLYPDTQMDKNTDIKELQY